MNKSKSIRVKIMSAFLAVLFSLGELSHAAPVNSFVPGDRVAADTARFEAPLDFVTVKDMHQGQNGTLIIHIQDAHSNLSGQENLAKALDAILTKYHVSLVLSEGGQGDCSLTPIKKIASPDVWKRLAKSYLIQGKISGEEYLNLVSDKPMKIMGLENIDLYLTSVRDYALLADKRSELLGYLKQIQQALSKIKNKLYPAPLLAYENDFRDSPGSSEAQGHFEHLLELAAEQKIPLDGYLNALKLVELKLKEKLIDFTLANLEQASLFDELSRYAGADELKNELLKAAGKQNSKTALLAYFQNTFDMAKKNHIQLNKYPNLTKYEEYLEDYSRVDMEALLQELSQIENQLYSGLLNSPDAKTVRAIDRYLKLLNTAYNIQMTTAEFDVFKANEPDFTAPAYIGFINRKLSELGYFDDVILYDPSLEAGKRALENFYGSVRERDFAFLSNAEKILAGEKQQVAVLISGGYHTAHLKKLFTEKGYSMVVLAPIVTSETNQEKYEKLLLGPLNKKVKRVEVVQGENKTDRSLAALGSDLSKAKKDGVRVAEGMTEFSLNPGNSRLAALIREAADPETAKAILSQLSQSAGSRLAGGAASQRSVDVRDKGVLNEKYWHLFSQEDRDEIMRLLQTNPETAETNQRSFVYSLKTPVQIGNLLYKSLQIKGFYPREGEELVLHEGSGAAQFHLFGKNAISPEGAMYADLARAEYEATAELFESKQRSKEFSVKAPILWGTFSRMAFQGKAVGFVALAVPEDYERRLDMREYKKTADLMSVVYYSGRALGSLHALNEGHGFYHPGNISMAPSFVSGSWAASVRKRWDAYSGKPAAIIHDLDHAFKIDDQAREIGADEDTVRRIDLYYALFQLENLIDRLPLSNVDIRNFLKADQKDKEKFRGLIEKAEKAGKKARREFVKGYLDGLSPASKGSGKTDTYWRDFLNFRAWITENSQNFTDGDFTNRSIYELYSDYKKSGSRLAYLDTLRRGLSDAVGQVVLLTYEKEGQPYFVVGALRGVSQQGKTLEDAVFKLSFRAPSDATVPLGHENLTLYSVKALEDPTVVKSLEISEDNLPSEDQDQSFQSALVGKIANSAGSALTLKDATGKENTFALPIPGIFYSASLNKITIAPYRNSTQTYGFIGPVTLSVQPAGSRLASENAPINKNFEKLGALIESEPILREDAWYYLRALNQYTQTLRLLFYDNADINASKETIFKNMDFSFLGRTALNNQPELRKKMKEALRADTVAFWSRLKQLQKAGAEYSMAQDSLEVAGRTKYWPKVERVLNERREISRFDVPRFVKTDADMENYRAKIAANIDIEVEGLVGTAWWSPGALRLFSEPYRSYMDYAIRADMYFHMYQAMRRSPDAAGTRLAATQPAEAGDFGEFIIRPAAEGPVTNPLLDDAAAKSLRRQLIVTAKGKNPFAGRILFHGTRIDPSDPGAGWRPSLRNLLNGNGLKAGSAEAPTKRTFYFSEDDPVFAATYGFPSRQKETINRDPYIAALFEINEDALSANRAERLIHRMRSRLGLYFLSRTMPAIPESAIRRVLFFKPNPGEPQRGEFVDVTDKILSVSQASRAAAGTRLSVKEEAQAMIDRWKGFKSTAEILYPSVLSKDSLDDLAALLSEDSEKTAAIVPYLKEGLVNPVFNELVRQAAGKGFTVLTSPTFNPDADTLIVAKDAAVAAQILKLFKDYENKKADAYYHQTLGRLLGFPEDQITSYLEKKKLAPPVAPEGARLAQGRDAVEQIARELHAQLRSPKYREEYKAILSGDASARLQYDRDANEVFVRYKTPDMEYALLSVDAENYHTALDAHDLSALKRLLTHFITEDGKNPDEIKTDLRRIRGYLAYYQSLRPERIQNMNLAELDSTINALKAIYRWNEVRGIALGGRSLNHWMGQARALRAYKKSFDEIRFLDKNKITANLREMAGHLDAINSRIANPDRHYLKRDFEPAVIERYAAAVDYLNSLMPQKALTGGHFLEAYQRLHQLLADPSSDRPGEMTEEEKGRIREMFTKFNDVNWALLMKRPDKGVMWAANTFVRLANAQPFRDGNKRAANLIMNYILLKTGNPAFILSEDIAAAYAKVAIPTNTNNKILPSNFMAFLSERLAAERKISGARLAKFSSLKLMLREFAQDAPAERQYVLPNGRRIAAVDARVIFNTLSEPEIKAFVARTARLYLREFGGTIESNSAEIQDDRLPHRGAWILLNMGGGVVGRLNYYHFYPPDAAIDRIAIRLGVRKQGVGAFLLDVFLRDMREKGVTEVSTLALRRVVDFMHRVLPAGSYTETPARTDEKDRDFKVNVDNYFKLKESQPKQGPSGTRLSLDDFRQQLERMRAAGRQGRFFREFIDFADTNAAPDVRDGFAALVNEFIVGEDYIQEDRDRLIARFDQALLSNRVNAYLSGSDTELKDAIASIAERKTVEELIKIILDKSRQTDKLFKEKVMEELPVAESREELEARSASLAQLMTAARKALSLMPRAPEPPAGAAVVPVETIYPNPLDHKQMSVHQMLVIADAYKAAGKPVPLSAALRELELDFAVILSAKARAEILASDDVREQETVAAEAEALYKTITSRELASNHIRTMMQAVTQKRRQRLDVIAENVMDEAQAYEELIKLIPSRDPLKAGEIGQILRIIERSFDMESVVNQERDELLTGLIDNLQAHWDKEKFGRQLSEMAATETGKRDVLALIMSLLRELRPRINQAQVTEIAAELRKAESLFQGSRLSGNISAEDFAAYAERRLGGETIWLDLFGQYANKARIEPIVKGNGTFLLDLRGIESFERRTIAPSEPTPFKAYAELEEKLGAFAATVKSITERSDNVDMTFFIRELLSNAFVHGNGSDFEQPIAIHFDTNSQGSIQKISVMDLGLEIKPDEKTLESLKKSELSGKQEFLPNVRMRGWEWNYQKESAGGQKTVGIAVLTPKKDATDADEPGIQEKFLSDGARLTKTFSAAPQEEIKNANVRALVLGFILSKPGQSTKDIVLSGEKDLLSYEVRFDKARDQYAVNFFSSENQDAPSVYRETIEKSELSDLARSASVKAAKPESSVSDAVSSAKTQIAEENRQIRIFLRAIGDLSVEGVVKFNADVFNAKEALTLEQNMQAVAVALQNLDQARFGRVHFYFYSARNDEAVKAAIEAKLSAYQVSDKDYEAYEKRGLVVVASSLGDIETQKAVIQNQKAFIAVTPVQELANQKGSLFSVRPTLHYAFYLLALRGMIERQEHFDIQSVDARVVQEVVRLAGNPAGVAEKLNTRHIFGFARGDVADPEVLRAAKDYGIRPILQFIGEVFQSYIRNMQAVGSSA